MSVNFDDLGNAYVGGAWQSTARDFPVENPATGETIARVADLDRAQIDAAIGTAAAALPAWSARSAHERAAVLKRWAAALLAGQEDGARLMTAEQGKPLAEARAEVAFAASFFEWFAEEAKRAYGEVIPSPFPSKRYSTLRQPAGVAAAITPWNFPIAMLARKAAAALAAGCTMVAKPAAETPLCALWLARLADEAQVPAGVFNVVTTSDAPAAGAAFCESGVVRVLSFTGSTAVGKLLFRQSAATVKRLALELGGNAPLLVFDDADLDVAVAGTLAAKFRNAGQTCVSANRVYVQAGIHAAYVERLVEAVRRLRVGDGRDDGVTIGPLITPKAVAKVERLVRDALARGARALIGGAPHPRGACFFEPTVLDDVRAGSALLAEEIFGPVVPVVRFETEAEAVAQANAVDVGLAAYAFTRDLSRAVRLSESLQAGIVAINEGLPSVAVAPFGGIKESGLGREGGRQGLDEYMDTKFVCLGVG